MKSAAEEIQTALYAKLQSEHSFGNRWYTDDGQPGISKDDFEDPYGIISTVTYTRDDAQSVSGADHLFALDHFGVNGSTVRQALAETDGILDGAALVVTGDNSAWWVKLEGTVTITRDDVPDRRHTRGVQTFRIRTVDTS